MAAKVTSIMIKKKAASRIRLLTARNIVLMKRNIVFYMIITQESFIFNDKLNVSFTHCDRYMTDIVNICESVSMLFCLLSERYIIK